MIVKIVSFHNGNLNPELIEMQKKVFEHFEIPLEQIKTDFSHPAAIDWYLDKHEWDAVVIFDADCIPLNKDVVITALSCLTDNLVDVYGAAQKASHIPNSKIYCSPAFIAFTKKTYEKIGKPSFHATERGDVGEEITYKAIEKGLILKILLPKVVEKPMWELADGIMFGYGTSYRNEVYHAFESNANHHSTSRFIEKCKEIIAQ